jgi:hypothetical protein
MALPHFRNIVTANTMTEPIYQNLFEVTIDIPTIVQTNSTENRRILLENAKSIQLNLTDGSFNIEPVKQKFKYSTRTYATTPAQSHVEFTVNFNVNQTDKKSVDVWALLKRWYDLAWNSQTGELHYKIDMVGQITAQLHDRTGEVIRRVDFINCQLKSVTGWEFDWNDSTEIISVTASFVADYWNDTYFTAGA